MADNDILALNNEDYMAPTTVWDELTSETQRLNKILDSGQSLTPDDVKDVSALAHQIRNYSALYRKAVNNKAKQYRQFLDQRLTEIGYGQIEQYVQKRHDQAVKARNDRQNAKLTKFNELVNSKLKDLPHLANSSIANSVSNDLSLRFPKLNSGAKNKEITNWKPIESVVTLSLNKTEQLFIDNPVISDLPSTAYSLRVISRYLATGNEKLISKKTFTEYLKRDQELIETLAINKLYPDDSRVRSGIQDILNSDTDEHTQLVQIYKLLNIYNRNHVIIK